MSQKAASRWRSARVSRTTGGEEEERSRERPGICACEQEDGRGNEAVRQEICACEQEDERRGTLTNMTLFMLFRVILVIE